MTGSLIYLYINIILSIQMYHLQQVNLTQVSQHHKTMYLKITEKA